MHILCIVTWEIAKKGNPVMHFQAGWISLHAGELCERDRGAAAA